MRILLLALALLTGASAQTYPGTPVYTINGPLQCGARLYAANQVQTYCFLSIPGQPVAALCNRLDTISPSATGTVTMSQNYTSCQSTQVPNTQPGTVGTVYWVAWLVWQPNLAGPIQYQIGSGGWPCTMSQAQTGLCDLTAGASMLTGQTIVGHF